MTRDTGRSFKAAVVFDAGERTGRGVVNTRAAPEQPSLKAVCALAQVVHQSHKLAVGLGAENRSKAAAQSGSPDQVLRHCLTAKAIV